MGANVMHPATRLQLRDTTIIFPSVIFPSVEVMTRPGPVVGTVGWPGKQRGETNSIVALPVIPWCRDTAGVGPRLGFVENVVRVWLGVKARA